MAEDTDEAENEAEPTALLASQDAGLDAYEKRFMSGEGTVLLRSKARAHWSLAAMIFGIGAVSAAGLFASAGPVAAGLLVASLALMWLLFAVLRVTVSERSVSIQLALFGPTIPVAAIERAEARRYTFGQFGGWGVRLSPRGTMYNMPGDGGHALRIVWRTTDGKRRTTWVGTRDAPVLVRAIEQARAALPAAPDRALTAADAASAK